MLSQVEKEIPINKRYWNLVAIKEKLKTKQRIPSSSHDRKPTAEQK